MNLTARTLVVDADAEGAQSLSLADLPLQQPATVLGIADQVDPATGRRLFDLGFCAGTPIVALRRTPLGGPRVYRVGDYDLALRAHEAAAIQVSQA